MENIGEFLILSFSTLLFCLGIYVFFHGYSEYNMLFKNVTTNYQEGPVLVIEEEAGLTLEDEYYPKGYLVALLLKPLDYDILLDNSLISKAHHDKSKIRDYGLDKEYYRKEYIYDNKGDISKIRFY
ncbi:MAG: hypothetical protein GX323_07070 [Clostridiales bacterium]|nr:hypothetical protein [Clostridiales bacterium]